jgi:hypothetical protein
MNSEARVTAMPHTAGPEKTRRGRKSSEGKEKGPLIFFFMAEPTSDSGVLVLKEKFEVEGDAVVASLTRGKPYYRVEVWQSRAVVHDNDGTVSVEKNPVRDSG